MSLEGIKLCAQASILMSLLDIDTVCKDVDKCIRIMCIIYSQKFSPLFIILLY